MSSKRPARGAAAQHGKRGNAKLRGDPARGGFRLEDSPFFLINRTAGFYGLAMERALRAVGADIPRWRVLMLAHLHGPISVGDIADQAVLKLPTTTKVVQRLAAEGLVTLRRRATDARVTEVISTRDGDAAVELIRQAASRVYREACRDLSAAEIRTLSGILLRVQRNLQALR